MSRAHNLKLKVHRDESATCGEDWATITAICGVGDAHCNSILRIVEVEPARNLKTGGTMNIVGSLPEGSDAPVPFR
jgi:hypothetical protein